MPAPHDDAPTVPGQGPGGVVVGGGPRPRRPAWLLPVAVGGLAAAATVVLAVRSPHAGGSYGVCPVLALTGLWCPACGGLRAAHELTQLDLAGAWAMNPLLVLGAPLLVAAWGLWLARSLGWRPGQGPAGGGVGRGPGAGRAARLGTGTWPAWTVLAVTAAFTVARNVPALAPWLAPV